MSQLIGSGEAAKILGVNRRTITRYAKSGLLRPAHKMPGQTGARLYAREAVETLKAELPERECRCHCHRSAS